MVLEYVTGKAEHPITSMAQPDPLSFENCQEPILLGLESLPARIELPTRVNIFYFTKFTACSQK